MASRQVSDATMLAETMAYRVLLLIFGIIEMHDAGVALAQFEDEEVR